MERPFSSKVIDAVYSGYSGDSFDPDAAIDAVLELLPEQTVQPSVETVAHAIYDCTGLNRAVLEDAREIAQAVLALIGGRTEAEVKAEALEEAAGASMEWISFKPDGWGSNPADQSAITAMSWVLDWLRDRAAAIRGEQC